MRGIEAVVMSNGVKPGQLFYSLLRDGPQLRILGTFQREGQPISLVIELAPENVIGRFHAHFWGHQEQPVVTLPPADVRIEPDSIVSTGFGYRPTLGQVLVHGREAWMHIALPHALGFVNLATGEVVGEDRGFNGMMFNRWSLVTAEVADEQTLFSFAPTTKD